MNLAIASRRVSAYSETFIQMQLERLPCALRIHGPPIASETIPGGPILPLKSVRGLVDTVYWRGFRGMQAEGPQAAELKRRLVRQQVNVLLANYGPLGVALLPLCKVLSIQLVVHFHGYDVHKRDVVTTYAPGYKELGRFAAAVIAVSEHMKEALIRHGIPEAKIRLIRYGVDRHRFVPNADTDGQPVFFGVGRFVDKKAPYLTLMAFAKARKRVPMARLVLAGVGPLLEVTHNLAITLGVENAVDFVGVLKPDEVARWMQKATAFVQHSITPVYGSEAGDSEGTPVAVLEALMSGLPVISTRHAGIGEVVEHRRTGILVAERDIDGMAAAMVEVVENIELAKSLGETARVEALANYSSDQYIDSLNRVLAEVAR